MIPTGVQGTDPASWLGSLGPWMGLGPELATVSFSCERLEEWTNSANEPALHCREANEPAG